MTRAKKSGAARAKTAQTGGATPGGGHSQSPLSGVARAASALAIVSVRLTSFTATATNRPGEPLPERLRPTIGFTKPELAATDDSLIVSSTFLFRLAPDDASSRPLLHLRATAELVYARRPETKVADADVEAFASINVPFNAWPYWREFTQTSLARLGLPVFPLPLFRAADAQRLVVADVDAQ